MIHKNKFTFNGKLFDKYNQMDAAEEGWSPVYYHGGTCCSLGIISAKNYHSLEELQYAINHIKKDSNERVFSPKERDFGEQSVLCVTSPGEEQLERNLKQLKFKLVSNKLKRRRGYPMGLLKLYLLTF